MKKYILIFGGGLSNKGAQAMSFIAISEFAKRFPEYKPILVSPDDCKPNIVDRMRGKSTRDDSSNFAFEIAWGNTNAVKSYYLKTVDTGIELASLSGVGYAKFVSRAKAAIQKLIRMPDILRQKEFYENAAFAIDISGFAMGDPWGMEASMDYLRGIELAQKFNVPLYLLPQSFGPFDYDCIEESSIIRARASHVLQYPRIIFARESASLEALFNICPEARLRRSDDLVLQSKGIELNRIFEDIQALPPHAAIETSRNVGIVPNARNVQHGDSKTLSKLYRSVVTNLLQEGYRVYLIRHASEDLEMCQAIKEGFSRDDRVRVLGEDRYCFEYEELFAACDFLIASRFHSIVHAYRRGTPCISLGWAVKYKELLRRFGQERYVFDVTEGNFDEEAFAIALDEMKRLCRTYRKPIYETMEQVQSHNVFDCVENDFRKTADRV